MEKSEFYYNLPTSPELGRARTPSNHSSHIPVPKSPRSLGTPNKSSLYSITKRTNNTNSNIQGPTVSVAAHLASYESLDATVNNTNKRTLNDNNISKIHKSINSRLNNNVFNHENNWKNQHKKLDTKRQIFCQKNNTNDDSKNTQNNKYAKENIELQAQVREKEEKLEKLRTVSEAVCKEYEQLKRQYEIEMGAMHKAMQQASQWYKQNRQLKRRSQALVSRILESRPDALADDLYLSDEVDANENDDAEELRQTITELSSEVAKLQTELNSARLQEFEAQEQAALTNAKWEEEKELREKNDDMIKQLIDHKEKMENVTRLMNEQLQELKNQCEQEKINARLFKIEAENAKKERKVLAHQSALLMADNGHDENIKFINAIQEIENLKRLLEEEKLNHQEKIEGLELKLKENEINVEFEIVEEKLKLAEVEYDLMQERADRAENEVERLREIVEKLEDKIDDNENKKVQVIAVAPPPPPPPPPPPGLLQFNESANASIKLLTREKLENRNSAICDMENMLGIPKRPCAIPQQPAIDDIINQIKGGRFTLKQTDKQREEEKRRKRESETAPPAVSEMLTILGTMRRRAKPTRQSFKFQDFPLQSNQGA